MGNWKNWLFPILTVLTVAALALLPLRLSTLRDGELTETVHAEELPADSNFPSKPPELPTRLWLLVQWQEMPEHLTIMSQNLEGLERDREFQRLRDALTGLKDILPPGLADQLIRIDGNSWDCSRYYLRDQTDLSSASFSLLGTYDKSTNIAFFAKLDGESGQLAELQVTGAADVKFDRSPVETGRALLDYMGLSYEAVSISVSEEVYGESLFRLPESNGLFYVDQYDSSLAFGFQVNWELMDASLSKTYGYPVDSGSMQKW